MSIERRRLLYSGSVQGVGFRKTTLRLARGFAVGGFVRNLADGRVELVAEGEAAVVASFVGAVRERLGDSIRDVEGGPIPADAPSFEGFTIRFD